jgi:hypothetical protein
VIILQDCALREENFVYTSGLETQRAIGVDYSCQTLIEKYDYRRAAEIATAVGKQGSRGPVLTAWTKAFEENDSEALVLDLSFPI